MFEKFLLRISQLAKFNLVSPFISFDASAFRLPKRNEPKKRAACPKLLRAIPRAPRWTAIPHAQGFVYLLLKKIVTCNQSFKLNILICFSVSALSNTANPPICPLKKLPIPLFKSTAPTVKSEPLLPMP